MREYIYTNLRVIKKHFKVRSKNVSEQNRLSIIQEFKEWGDNPSIKEHMIWTLPDLTRIERFSNFCRSIKKQIR